MSKTKTNGHIPQRNGDAPANRVAGILPPLDTVSTVDPPGPAGDAKPTEDGRTAKGTFGPGNTFARGNPNARKMAALRSALLGNLTAEKMVALGDRLYELALGGDLVALKMLLLYAIGKPPDAVNADRLDLDEWRILDDAPTMAQLLRLRMDGIDPKDAAEIYERCSHNGKSPLDRFAAALDDNDMARRIGEERKARVGK